LKSHVLSVHKKRLDFACEHCGKRWPTLKVLEGHVKQTHTQNVKCEICDKKISNPIELRRAKYLSTNKLKVHGSVKSVLRVHSSLNLHLKNT
jgi:Zn finger protein HypA/HybF involved in hydrogenase expression